VLLRKPCDYDPSDHDAIVTVLQPAVERDPIAVLGEPSCDEPIVIQMTDRVWSSTWSAAERTPALRLGRRGALYGLSAFRRNNSGSLAKFAASRRASSLVSSLAAERRPGSSSK
jgi:hypothetical protein